MLGQMMNAQLTIGMIMQHARKFNASTEIVSVTADNPRHRTNFGESFRRAAQLANALAKRGADTGDRIATLARNDYRHLEIYFATASMGAVCHTINPRLFPEQIEYIANHVLPRVRAAL